MYAVTFEGVIVEVNTAPKMFVFIFPHPKKWCKEKW